jgi:hypothetical protein
VAAARPSGSSIRYYLWADDGLWRIPERVHLGLVSGAIGLSQYANTKQKVVEVFLQRDRRHPTFVRARGVYYHFDKDGRLNLSNLSEAAARALEGSRHRHVVDNLFDIGPAVRHRRWLETQTWRLNSAILRQIAVPKYLVHADS